jgi:hypothetical protein
MAVCFFTAIEAAWGEARLERVGFIGYTLAVIGGLIIGGLCAWTMWRLSNAVVTRIFLAQPSPRERWYLRLLYFSAIFWIVLAGFLGRFGAMGLLKLTVNRYRTTSLF